MGLSGINRFNDAGCLPLTTQEWLEAAKLPKHTKMIQLHSSQVDYAIDAEHDNQHKCQQWPPQQEPLGIALSPSVDPLAHGPWRPEIHQEGYRHHGVSQGQVGDKIRHPSEHNVNLVGVYGMLHSSSAGDGTKWIRTIDHGFHPTNWKSSLFVSS